MAEKDVFVGASIELFSRLWGELETIAATVDVNPGAATVATDLRAEIVRLELIVLLDACRAMRWRMLLEGEQRRALDRCLSDVLEWLNAKFDEAPAQAIHGAQNCLLDAILELHRGDRQDPLPDIEHLAKENTKLQCWN
jgi:hypothetical protein